VEAFYNTHPGWSAEVIIDQQNRLDIKQLALLGGERPHFKNLTEYSQFYGESKVGINMENSDLEQEPEQDYVEADTEELLQQMLQITENLESEIEALNKQITALQEENQQYAEQTLAAEVEALYAEVISYGCNCDKETVASNYSAMGAQLRPQYRATLIDIAKSAKALAKSINRQPNLLYGEEAGEPSVADVKKKLRRLADVR
jgi:DNA repair exonuclease SbcCD ATPase subunit